MKPAICNRLFALLLTLLAVGCATTGDLYKLEIGMPKGQVVKIMGEPDVARGSIRNKYDQVIEVWEYTRQKATGDLPVVRPQQYWLYFCEGKLVQWGEAGDWQREADRIYEIRYR
jgi:outer membrane protein assembly factor BamE (lipoprotein component of BamABCDE complex)